MSASAHPPAPADYARPMSASLIGARPMSASTTTIRIGQPGPERVVPGEDELLPGFEEEGLPDF